MEFNIIPNKSFLADFKLLSKKYPSLKEDINEVVQSLKNDPKMGESLGKDCYKIRVAIKSKGRGKNGGARLITCVKIIQSTVYLISIYDKSDLDNIAEEDLKARLKEIK